MPAPAGGEGPCPSAALLNDGLAIEASLRVPSICTWRIRDCRDREQAPPEATGVSFNGCGDAGAGCQQLPDAAFRSASAGTQIPEDDTSRRPRPAHLSLVLLRHTGPGPMLRARSVAVAGTPLTSEVWAPLPLGTLAPSALPSQCRMPSPDTPVGSAAVAEPPARGHGPIHTDPGHSVPRMLHGKARLQSPPA